MGVRGVGVGIGYDGVGDGVGDGGGLSVRVCVGVSVGGSVGGGSGVDRWRRYRYWCRRFDVGGGFYAVFSVGVGIGWVLAVDELDGY